MHDNILSNIYMLKSEFSICHVTNTAVRKRTTRCDISKGRTQNHNFSPLEGRKRYYDILLSTYAVLRSVEMNVSFFLLSPRLHSVLSQSLAKSHKVRPPT